MEIEIQERLDRLEARVYARNMGLRAVIASHPAPEALMQAWRAERAASEVHLLQSALEAPGNQPDFGQLCLRSALDQMDATFEAVLGPRLR